MGTQSRLTRTSTVAIADHALAPPIIDHDDGFALAWRSYRVRQWLHFLALPAARLDLAAAQKAPLQTALALGFGCALGGLVLASAYGINAAHDREFDIDTNKNPLVRRELPVGFGWQLAAPAVLALLLAPLGGWVSVGAVVVALASSQVYSARLRWKAVPGLGSLLNVGIFTPLLLMAPLAPLTVEVALLAVVFSALLLQNQLLHELSDADEDASAGLRTTALVLGPQGTRAAMVAVAIVGLVAVAFLAPSAALFVGSGCIVVACSTVTWWRGSPAQRRRWHRWLGVTLGAVLFGIQQWTVIRGG